MIDPSQSGAAAAVPHASDPASVWTHPHLTPAIAADGVVWENVASATYRIDQRFSYRYPGPIRNLRHRLVLSPPARHGAQERLARKLTFVPDLPSTRTIDAYGNEVVTVAVDRLDAVFDVSFSSLVRTYAGTSSHDLERGVAVRRDEFSYEDAPFALGLHTPERLTACDDAMREIGFEFQTAHRDEIDRARAISHFAYERIAYTKDVTDVATTAVQAFHLRHGVCQDFAHVTLAIGRAAGLACRYVLGHLLGEGGTHAWVEFLIPGFGGRTRVLALDPTHDREVTMRYVVVAVGRDYEDVAPTSGSFDAPYGGTFTARHAVTIARVSYS